MSEVQVPCPNCGGTGGQYVTPEMASDAGWPEMAGMELGCSTCNGDGWVLREEPDSKCELCGKAESEHALRGNWCPAKSEDELFSKTDKFKAAE